MLCAAGIEVARHPDLSHLAPEAPRPSVMLLRLALETAHDDYETRREREEQGIALAKQKGVYTGRKANASRHELLHSLRASGHSIAETVRS